MKLEEGKLILTEAELAEVKKANAIATPAIAGFYIECIQAYRKKNYEII